MKKILLFITALFTMVSLVGCQKQQSTNNPPITNNVETSTASV